jgi:hypothetical protein
VPEHRGDAVAVEPGREVAPLLEPLGRDQRAVRDALCEELRPRERLPVGEPARRERAQDLPVGVVDVAVRVAKGAVLDARLGVGYESSFFRMPRKPRNRRQ